MKPESEARNIATAALAAAGLLWPYALCRLTELTASPLERAAALAWCGAPPQSMLGHCPACWTGAAAFFLCALLLHFSAGRTVRAEARRRRR